MSFTNKPYIILVTVMAIAGCDGGLPPDIENYIQSQEIIWENMIPEVRNCLKKRIRPAFKEALKGATFTSRNATGIDGSMASIERANFIYKVYGGVMEKCRKENEAIINHYNSVKTSF